MSDDITPGQISAPLHKQGRDRKKKKGPVVPSNPFEVTAKHVTQDHAGDTTLSHVHIAGEAVATLEVVPPHALRIETAAYHKAHKYLVVTQDKPCVVCGVRNSTLADAKENIFQATAMETHHYPIERSLVNACDPDKVHHAFPEVIDQETLEAFVDSPRNLIILCSVHHRSLEQGIHHLLVQDYAILPYLYTNYQIVATAKDKMACEERDDQIEREHGKEI